MPNPQPPPFTRLPPDLENAKSAPFFRSLIGYQQRVFSTISDAGQGFFANIKSHVGVALHAASEARRFANKAQASADSARGSSGAALTALGQTQKLSKDTEESAAVARTSSGAALTALGQEQRLSKKAEESSALARIAAGAAASFANESRRWSNIIGTDKPADNATNNDFGGTPVGGAIDAISSSTFDIEYQTSNIAVFAGALRLFHTTDQTPTAGQGVAVDYLVENDAGVNKLGGQAGIVSTDIGSGTEDFDWIVKLMENSSAVAERFRVTHTGNVGLGTTTPGGGTTTGTRTISLANGTAPVGGVANQVSLYSADVTASAELFALDEAGNTPQLSPHPSNLLNNMPVKTGGPYAYPWSYSCANSFLGKRIDVDMAGLVEAVETLTGKTFAVVQEIPQSDWDANQERQRIARQEQIEAALSEIAFFDEEISRAETDKDLERLTELKAAVIVPEPYQKKPPPQWMIERGVKSSL